MEPNLFEQLAHMLEAKIPMPSGLRQLAVASRDPARRAQLEQMAQGIEAGQPLEQALQQAAPALDPSVWKLVSASQASGDLPQILFELARQGSDERRFISRLREMIAYPFFNILFAAGIVIFLFAKFGGAALDGLNYNNLDAGPNWLHGFLDGLAGARPILLIVWVIAALLFLLLMFGGRLTAPWILGLAQRLPGMRRVLRYLQSARVAKMLSSTVRSRLPLNEAVQAIRATLPSRQLKNALANAASAGNGGASPAEMLRQDGIDPLLPLVFEHAKAETLPDELSRIATVLEDRAAFRQERFVRRWTLGLYIVMAVIGLAVMLLMFMPYIVSLRSLLQ